MTTKKLPNTGKPTVSPLTVWLAVIASTLVMILLYALLIWADNQTDPTHAVQAETQTGTDISTTEAIFLAVIVGAIILGPGIVVALIVLPILRKNKRGK